MDLPVAPHPLVPTVRRFNRFYTTRIGAIGGNYLGVDVSLTEARTLYEIAQAPGITSKGVGALLALDAGYLSRVLSRLQKIGLIERRHSARDGRERPLSLTAAGYALYRAMDARSDAEVAAMLAPLAEPERQALAAALRRVEHLISVPSPQEITLRQHRPGDMGWVIMRHAEIYASDYGWDERFEALVAEIAARFVKDYDAAHERCWIAERDGERVGSVFVVRQSADVAKLRMLIVDPSARGTGLGRRLVSEALAFARAAGYRQMTLWTQQNLTAARRIYAGLGFRCVDEEPYRDIGQELVSETWLIDL